MPRRLWSNLKPSTKNRYRRAGIHPNTYNAGKANLTAARGHAHTPERPGRRVSDPAYADYYARQQPQVEHVTYVEVYARSTHSDDVKQAIGERVYQMFGDRHKYRGRFLDPDFPPSEDYPAAPEDDEIMEILENTDDYELEYLVTTDPSYWWLYYH